MPHMNENLIPMPEAATDSLPDMWSIGLYSTCDWEKCGKKVLSALINWPSYASLL